MLHSHSSCYKLHHFIYTEPHRLDTRSFAFRTSQFTWDSEFRVRLTSVHSRLKLTRRESTQHACSTGMQNDTEILRHAEDANLM